MSPDATPDGAAAAAGEDFSPEGEDVSPDGAAALVPGGRPDARPVTAPEPPARAERRRRLQTLAGLTVHGSDGETVGRVRDIYQQDAGGELAAITVMPRQLSARSVLIPASAIATLPHAEQPDPDTTETVPDAGRLATGPAEATPDTAEPPSRNSAADTSAQATDIIRLTVDAATAKAGARPPQTLHASPQDLRDAVAALGLTEEGSAGA